MYSSSREGLNNSQPEIGRDIQTVPTIFNPQLLEGLDRAEISSAKRLVCDAEKLFPNDKVAQITYICDYIKTKLLGDIEHLRRQTDSTGNVTYSWYSQQNRDYTEEDIDNIFKAKKIKYDRMIPIILQKLYGGNLDTPDNSSLNSGSPTITYQDLNQVTSEYLIKEPREGFKIKDILEIEFKKRLFDRLKTVSCHLTADEKSNLEIMLFLRYDQQTGKFIFLHNHIPLFGGTTASRSPTFNTALRTIRDEITGENPGLFNLPNLS